ncbi:MAG: tRNA (guanosine(46)-N7)-methyltransferase TrmB [Clostridia bacterium]
MRLRNKPNAKNELAAEAKFIESKEQLEKILDKNKNKKINIEIGMGKGDFITNMAYENPTEIFIGIELSISVASIAIKKINRFEQENNTTLDNLILMSFDAISLSEIFKENSVDKLYLNFSDPWPKKKHSKRRLTSQTFLTGFKKVLKDKAIIEFKTDNRGLFEYSLVSMQNFGLKFLNVYLDLHKTDIVNIQTEYEEKFSKFGPIYKLEAMLEK